MMGPLRAVFVLLTTFCVIVTTCLFLGVDIDDWILKKADGCKMHFHGNSHGKGPPGSCWCAEDHYCMCTPSLSVDVILEHPVAGGDGKATELLLVERQDGLCVCVVLRINGHCCLLS